MELSHPKSLSSQRRFYRFVDIFWDNIRVFLDNITDGMTGKLTVITITWSIMLERLLEEVQRAHAYCMFESKPACLFTLCYLQESLTFFLFHSTFELSSQRKNDFQDSGDSFILFIISFVSGLIKCFYFITMQVGKENSNNFRSIFV